MFLLTLFLSLANSSVIGFDIGSSFIKAGVFRAGRSIEIVLNEQSKRKTPSIVSFEPSIPITNENVRKIDRRIGVAAQSVVQRNSSSVIRFLNEIIGKNWSQELQNELNKRYLDYSMNGTKVNGIEPEIVLAMLFEKYVQHAKHQLQQDNIKEAVVSVPGYFTDYQKQKVAEAVEMSGLKLNKIIDEKTALSLQYAVDKHETFAAQPKTVVIIDFGSSALTTSAFRFSTKITAQSSKTKKVPIIEDLSYTWNDTIGGIDFDILLAEHLQKKWSLDKVDQTLINDAERIKIALTLGENANVTSDKLEKKVIFARSEFEQICGPIFQQIKNHLTEFSKTLKNKPDSVEIVGGATRMPKVISIIQEVFGLEVSRSLNSDEAIASGATFTATSISGGFKTSDIQHRSLYNYKLNIVIGENRTIPFKPKYNLEKQTIRFTPMKDTQFRIEYDGEVPIGCDKILGKWQYEPIEEVEGSEARVLFTLSINPLTNTIEPTKVSLAQKVGEKVSKRSLEITKVYPLNNVQKQNSIDNTARQLINSFTANDIRLAKIAETRNEYETQLYNAKDNFENDEIWSIVISPEEKENIRKYLNESYEWVFSKVNVETADEIIDRRNQLEELITPIQIRVNEYKTFPKALAKLKDLIHTVNITIDNKWPLSGIRVPKDQRKMIVSYMNEVSDWIDEFESEIESNKLKPWDEMPVTTNDVDLKTRKLNALFNKLKESVRRDDDENL